MKDSETAEDEKRPLNVHYDPETDILAIDDMKFSGSLFRDHLGVITPPGQWWRTTERKDGVIHVFIGTSSDIRAGKYE